MLKLDTNVGVICLGVLSVVQAFSYAVLQESFWEDVYLTVLQLLGGVGLIIGVQTKNYLCFLPWLIFTGWFTGVLSFVLWFIVIGPGPDRRIIFIFAPFVAFFWLALYSVTQAFNRIRRERALSALINNV